MSHYNVLYKYGSFSIEYGSRVGEYLFCGHEELSS